MRVKTDPKIAAAYRQKEYLSKHGRVKPEPICKTPTRGRHAKKVSA